MNLVPKRWRGLSGLAIATLGAGVATPAFAGEVYVVVNSNTGEVVVAGNSPDSPAWVRQNSIERSPQGWQQIYGDDASGWAAVSCIKLANGSYFFELASGHPSENAARGLADAAAQKRLPQVGGTIVAGCGYAWNNSGQQIALGPSQVRPGTLETESTSAAAPQRSAAGRTAAPAQRVATNQRQTLSTTPIGELATPVVVDRNKVTVPQSQPGVPSSSSGGRSVTGAVGTTGTSLAPTDASRARAGEARLRCRRPSDEADAKLYPMCDQNGNPIVLGSPASKGSSGNISMAGGSNQSPPSGSGSGRPDGRPSVQPPRNPGDANRQRFLHLEAVSVCEFTLPQSKFGNWRCLGPSTVTYVNFEGPDWAAALRQGGGKAGTNPRDLGVIGRYRVFGWGYPLFRHPDNDYDAAIKWNVPAIPGRYRYQCLPGSREGCLGE